MIVRYQKVPDRFAPREFNPHFVSASQLIKLQN